MNQKRAKDVIQSFKQSSGPGTLTSLAEFQSKTLSDFESLGFPDVKNENWKYTSPQSFINSSYFHEAALSLAPLPRLEDFMDEELLSKTFPLVFIDGRFCPEYSQGSLPTGFKFSSWKGWSPDSSERQRVEESLSALSEVGDSFQKWALSCFTEGLVMEVEKGVEVKTPILLVDLGMRSGEGDKMSPKTLVLHLAQNSKVTFFEYVHSSVKRDSWLQNLFSVTCEENAQFKYLKLQNEEDSNQAISFQQVRLFKNAELKSLSVVAGGKLLRDLSTIQHLEAEAVSSMSGLCLAGEGEHLEVRSRVEHKALRGKSSQRFKAVVSGDGRSVFNGKIYIAEGAQKVESSQLSKNLLLGKQAEVDTKPELEVYADDVKANHGASIGRLSEEQLFYLMSRGISRRESIQLLTKGFIQEAFSGFENEAFEKFSEKLIEGRMLSLSQMMGAL